MTLYRETFCELCGEPYGEHDEPVGDDCQGSGGSREEVTINYEAAYVVAPTGFRLITTDTVDAIVNAALGITTKDTPLTDREWADFKDSAVITTDLPTADEVFGILKDDGITTKDGE